MKLRKRIAAMGAAVMMATSIMSMNASAYKYARSDFSTKKSEETVGSLSEIADLTIDVPFFGKQSCKAEGVSEFIFNKKKTNYSASIIKNGHTIRGEYTGLGGITISLNNASVSSKDDSATYKSSDTVIDYSIKGKATRLYDFEYSSSVQYQIKDKKKNPIKTVVIEAGYDW